VVETAIGGGINESQWLFGGRHSSMAAKHQPECRSSLRDDWGLRFWRREAHQSEIDATDARLRDFGVAFVGLAAAEMAYVIFVKH